VDPQNFGFLAWNRACEDYYGRERGIQLRQGLVPADLFAEGSEYVELWNRMYRRARDEGPFRENYTVYTKSTILELNFHRIEDQGRLTGISVFGRNISEQVRAEQGLRESERWFRALFDQSGDAIFLNGLDGRVHRVNAEACRRLGYSEGELTQMRVHDFQTPESRATLGDKLAQLTATGHLLTEVTHVSRDGTRIPTEVHSRLVEIEGVKRILSVARDISVSKRAEAALSETERKYQVLFENSGTANALFDADSRLVLANTAFAQQTGRPPWDLVGLSVEDLTSSELGREFRERAQLVMSTGKPSLFLSKLSLNGRERWLQTIYSPLQDEQDNPRGLQIVGLDVTDQHLLSERIAQTEKFESIGVLAGGIAHDFNNLLAGLSGHLELARMLLEQNRGTEALARLDKASGVFERAKALTRQLLTFSRGGTPVLEVQDLGAALREWAEFTLSGSDLSLRVEVDPGLWPCVCDQNQISQVLDNLLINARQASPPGGVISVTAANVAAEVPQVRISVTDQGSGVSPALLTKIFDPFFTTKTRGTGLGLSVSLSIVRQHHGRIEVESPPGQGATFSVYLPARPQRSSIPGAAPADQFHGSGWALVLDDEEVLRDTLGEMLSFLGFSVLRAKDGHDALACFTDAADHGHPIGLALLDLTIPGGMGGLETARKLKALGATAVLVAISGYSEASGREDLKAEFDGILAKPFSLADLARFLRHKLSER
jgi:PAS domain S-box-containing protein